MSYTMIRKVEKEIAEKFVSDALKSGHTLSVSLDRGYDVEDMLKGSSDKAKIVDEIFAGDDAHVFVHAKGAPAIVDGQVNSIGWVYFVLGNDGWDVISDYTTNLERLLEGANKLAQSYE